jgi:lambda repressor-like predicted transcriptional regulator
MKLTEQSSTESKSHKDDEFAIWAVIKHSLELQGLTFGKLAKIHDVNKSNFIHIKHHPCPKFEKIVAEKLGVPAWGLWPHRYNEHHEPARISLRYHNKEFTEHRIKKMRECNQKNIGEMNHAAASGI